MQSKNTDLIIYTWAVVLVSPTITNHLKEIQPIALQMEATFKAVPRAGGGSQLFIIHGYYEGIQLHGCWFDYYKNVYKRARALHLVQQDAHPLLMRIVKITLALPLLPQESIEEGVTYVRGMEGESTADIAPHANIAAGYNNAADANVVPEDIIVPVGRLLTVCPASDQSVRSVVVRRLVARNTSGGGMFQGAPLSVLRH
ncbi:hypothetical protein CBL_20127 [Carabus blaptoides fortunei]